MTFLLVMDKGDEAFDQVPGFAECERITAASLPAIGAVRSATLGYFDPQILQDRYTSFEEQLDLASCVGGIADNNGEPALQAHIVLSRKDSSALAGHQGTFSCA